MLTFLETKFIGQVNKHILDLFFGKWDIRFLCPSGLKQSVILTIPSIDIRGNNSRMALLAYDPLYYLP